GGFLAAHRRRCGAAKAPAKCSDCGKSRELCQRCGNGGDDGDEAEPPEKPFKCQERGKSFGQRSALGKHR
ncbi:ZN845 protein, partial [Pomatostomus ruficeps]|nr:ZN845 protein [Pomatostomus ruficeps]